MLLNLLALSQELEIKNCTFESEMRIAPAFYATHQGRCSQWMRLIPVDKSWT